jgi:hypothetical protein
MGTTIKWHCEENARFLAPNHQSKTRILEKLMSEIKNFWASRGHIFGHALDPGGHAPKPFLPNSQAARKHCEALRGCFRPIVYFDSMGRKKEEREADSSTASRSSKLHAGPGARKRPLVSSDIMLVIADIDADIFEVLEDNIRTERNKHIPVHDLLDMIMNLAISFSQPLFGEITPNAPPYCKQWPCDRQSKNPDFSCLIPRVPQQVEGASKSPSCLRERHN